MTLAFWEVINVTNKRRKDIRPYLNGLFLSGDLLATFIRFEEITLRTEKVI